MRIAIASDHGGYELKGLIREHLETAGHHVLNLGVNDATSVDYPDQAMEACTRLTSGEVERAILVCGTGIGMSIAANKIEGGVR